MSIEEMQDAWRAQVDPHPDTGNDELIERIRTRSLAMARGDLRLAVFFGALALACWAWVGAWTVAFIDVGVETLRARDLYPPLGTAFVTPSYVGAICSFVVWRYLAKRRETPQANSLSGYVEESRRQLHRRIRLLRFAPPAFLICVLLATATLYFTPEFNYLKRISGAWAFVAFLPDLTILGGLTWWSRRAIRLRHQPRLAELESLNLQLDSGCP